ncbi:MAG: ABC transporter substrate-binding protein [Aquihabitans sp.]
MNTTRSRSPWRAPLALLAAFALVLAACGSDSDGAAKDDGASKGDGGGEKVSLSLRPQDFAESVTLTEVYAQFLATKGYDTSVQKPDGAFRDGVYPALEDGEADIVIDYTGSAATFLDPAGTPSADPDETYDRLVASLGDNLEVGAFSPAEDKNALVVLKSFAEEHDLTTISDLATVPDVVFGGSAQCMEREDCLLGYQGDTYGLTFKSVKTLDYGPPLAAGLKSGDIDAAQYQTTAPEIASGDFVVLEDDKGLLSADNVVPIVAAKKSDADLLAALDELSKQLTTEDLIAWNVRTDIDKDDPVDVATDWLEEKGLI